MKLHVDVVTKSSRERMNYYWNSRTGRHPMEIIYYLYSPLLFEYIKREGRNEFIEHLLCM